MSTQEEIKTLVSYYFETYGLSVTEEEFRKAEISAQMLNTTVAELMKNYREMNNLPTEGIARFNAPSLISPQMGQQAFLTQTAAQQQAVSQAWMTTGTPTPKGYGWEDFDRQFNSMQLVVGAASNLVHMYYWIESAQERLENATLRLANAQDVYSNAVAKYGVNSQQAISASRTLEIAENNLERAHAREILNIGLLGIQAVQMIGHFTNLAKTLTSVTIPATVAQTAANQGLAVSQALVNALSGNWIALAAGLAIGGTAVGLLSQHFGAIDTATEEMMSRGEVPFGAQAGFEGYVSKPTLFLAGEAGGEHVSITPSGRGGVTIGDTIINVETLDDVDQAYDRQRWNVKNQLRRMVR